MVVDVGPGSPTLKGFEVAPVRPLAVAWIVSLEPGELTFRKVNRATPLTAVAVAVPPPPGIVNVTVPSYELSTWPSASSAETMSVNGSPAVDRTEGLLREDELSGDPVGGQVGDQLIGDRRAQAGHCVVAGPGVETAVAAGGHVVVIGVGQAVERGLGLLWAGTGIAAIEGCATLGDTALVGDRDQRGPGGRRKVGVAIDVQGCAGIVIRIVDRDTRVRIGIERDVGNGPLACALSPLLVRRLGFILAGAAIGRRPGGFAVVRIVRIERQTGAADRDHVG